MVTSFNYSPSQPLNFVDESAISIKKYFGVEELSTGGFVLGGSFQNGDNSDFFIQIVSATGNEEHIKKFENSGYDADY